MTPFFFAPSILCRCQMVPVQDGQPFFNSAGELAVYMRCQNRECGGFNVKHEVKLPPAEGRPIYAHL